MPAVRVWDLEGKNQVAEFHGHEFCICYVVSFFIVGLSIVYQVFMNTCNKFRHEYMRLLYSITISA